MSDQDHERFALERVRNLGILAHIDAGKTTLTERVLYFTGRSAWLGEVDHGTASTDFLPEEQERGITILAAATMCPWRDHQINLIDTPGHVDFTAEVERSLRVLDGAVVVVSAVEGVQPQTERVWTQADRHGVPRVVFVNKLDREGASLERALLSLRERLGVEPVALALPVGAEHGLVGVLDLVNRRLLRPARGRELVAEEVPDHLIEELELGRELLLDAVLLDDEGALERFYETGDVSAQETWRSVRRATLAGRIVPVFCGAAKHSLGVGHLLDGLVEVLPSPCDRPPALGVGAPSAGAPGRPPSDEAPFAGLVFKFQAHGRGYQAFTRIYSGAARAGEPVWVPRLHASVTLGRLSRVSALELTPLAVARAGDIVAIEGLDALVSGDTLCDPEHPIALEPIGLPAPVLYVALEPMTEQEDLALRQSVAWLRRRDPSLQVRQEAATGRQLLCGMGELHLEVALEWLRRERGIAVSAGTPQVAYREVPLATGPGVGTVDRLVGGRGRFAHVALRVGPGPLGQGEQVRMVGRSPCPRTFVDAAMSGVREALRQGPAAGFPVVDVWVELTELRHHVDDSTDQSFQLAGVLATRDALDRVGCAVFEPTMRVEIVTPEDYMGAVLGDLHSRRGNVLDMVAQGRQQSVQAVAPLADLRGYATALRSLTQGRATVTMHLDSYTPLPAKLAQQLTGRT